MKVLSIDVGIKNLAFCLMEKMESTSDYKILMWDIVDLSQREKLKCNETNKNKPCESVVKYTKDNKYYCLKHSKKQCYIQPKAELRPTALKKHKIQKLYDIMQEYQISYTTPIKKIELIEIINNFVHDKCFEPVDGVDATKLDIITIGRNIQYKLDELFKEHFDTITHVIIENQISPIANRMKTVQGMITQYFIIKSNIAHIEFISAANKLKNCEEEDKLSYSERKKTGIRNCLEIINDNLNYSEWNNYFNKHKKKDDLADSFLQLLWYINNKY